MEPSGTLRRLVRFPAVPAPLRLGLGFVEALSVPAVGRHVVIGHHVVERPQLAVNRNGGLNRAGKSRRVADRASPDGRSYRLRDRPITCHRSLSIGYRNQLGASTIVGCDF